MSDLDRQQGEGSGQTTGARSFLRALADNGVDYVFGNAGTDFAPLIEAFCKAAETGEPVPEPITVPHENVAICMAQGFTLATGRPQAVILHVNVGTANAICGLINAARENIPVFLAAGRTPVLERGRKGARSAFIHWGQEMFDQGSMVREIVKWDYELRYPEQAGIAVDRAMAMAVSAPQGPIYLTLPREVLAAETGGDAPRAKQPARAAPTVGDAALEEARAMLAASRRPLLICSRLGRTPREFQALARFAEAQAVGVVAYRTRYTALPTMHPSNLGYEVGAHLSEADLVLAVEADVPWIPAHHDIGPGAKVMHIAGDPEFARYPMRNFPSDLTLCGDAADALVRLAAPVADPAVLSSRQAFLTERGRVHQQAVAAARMPEADGPSTAVWIARCVAGRQRPDDRIVVEIPFPIQHMRFSEFGSYFQTPSAGGLGWVLGASLGLKLGDRTRRVISIVGDGSYMFGNPTPAHFVARALDLPTLTIIINNKMWGAVRRATLGVYPDGSAAASNRAPLTYLDPAPDYEMIVGASGGYGEKVEKAGDLPAALDRALEAVDEGRPAVLNVMTAYSDQDARADSRK